MDINSFRCYVLATVTMVTALTACQRKLLTPGLTLTRNGLKNTMYKSTYTAFQLKLVNYRWLHLVSHGATTAESWGKNKNIHVLGTPFTGK